MTINIVPLHSQVPLDSNASEKDVSLGKSNVIEFAPNPLSETPDLSVQNKRQHDSDSTENFLANEVPMVKGTYSVHDERCLSTPDFYESAYSRKQPWQEKQTNFGLQLANYGHFRSFFNVKGNYKNFFDTFEFSKAPSFYQQSQTPAFYSDEGNCSETTFYIEKRGTEYQTYKPFAAEPRGYMRSYFFGTP